ncbi:NACHT domain-containing protein [Micromonospora schwarzwaldensis]|uniref:NACHT domain-containing protein n=1 Tax=Micromonospora sp. DSM 45708 TaxID=3111767 RepID=UPI0031DF9553
MRGWRRSILVAAVPVVLAVVGNLATSTVQVTASWWPPVVWTATGLLGVAAVAVGVRDKSAAPSVTWRPSDLDEAADWLARALRERYVQAEEQRRVQAPPAMLVRFRPAPGKLLDHWSNIRRARPGAEPGPLRLAGTSADIARVHGRIPSGRLVVLGAAGAGKTVLVTRLALDLLDVRRPGGPVPVVLHACSWDPADPLRDWMVAQLAHDHPELAGPDRPGVAARLVGGGHVWPILDGFDDMPPRLRKLAIEQMNLAASVPLVLTSRAAEYEATVADGSVLAGAAGIELPGLTPTDLAHYLRRTSRPSPTATDTDRGGWGPVLARLGRHASDPAAAALAGALSTPLMVYLARTGYSDNGHDPAELLDRDRFPTADDLRQHLLTAFVPAVYRHRSPNGWTAEAARPWLTCLARYGGGSRSGDLAWWQLRDQVPRAVRVLCCGAVHGLAALLTVTLLTVLFSHFGGRGDAVLRPGVALSGVVALVGGLYTGWPARGAPPMRTQVRLHGRLRDQFRDFVVVFFIAKASFLPLKVILLSAGGWSLAFAFGTVPSIAVALSTAITVILLRSVEIPAEPELISSPHASLGSSRRSVLLRSGVVTLACVVGIGGAFGAFGGVTVGLAAAGMAIPARLAYVLTCTAWGSWSTLTRPYLAVTGRLPWRVIRFLDDARQRGILRQAGPVYRFRHEELRRRLAGAAVP